MKITYERNPSPAKLDVMGVYDWPIWSKEASTFPWTYEQKETCYILEGEVIVTPDDGGEPVHLQAGDLVTFASGLSCTWDIRQDIQKHYDFG
ncbi:MAG: cupin domain-containing protein [Gammaproteobacteria bacterium]|nr:MAG: cupin domain-containing protein [Gammaproteobacteria bacterium]